MKKLPILFIVIVLLGSFLRLWNVSSMPPALNWDEISHGYNAYSLLKTGSDEWGVHFPLANFRAYGDYPLTLNLYLTVPFVWAFGLTSFAIRFPHALLGIGTVILSYFLALGVSKKKSVAFVVMFLVSIDPWFFFTSRFVLQSNLSVFLLTGAMAAFFNRKEHRFLLPVSIFLLGLTLFAYHTTRIFTPLLLSAMVVVYKKQIITKWTVVIAILFFLPLPLILLNPDARARATDVFLLNEGSISYLETMRNQTALPSVVSKFLYNRPVYLIEQSAIHYADYFTPNFLFLKGGTQYQFSIPDFGVMNLISLPFFYVGMFFVANKALRKRDKTYQLILLWLLLAPIPASITTERFAVLRSTTLLPLPELLSALGLSTVFGVLSKRNKKYSLLFFSLFSVSALLFLLFYIFSYTKIYRTNYSWTWQFGYKEAVTYMSDHYSEYDRIIVTKKYGEPHEFVLFYNSWSPAAYKSDDRLVRYTQSNWWWVDSFDKYIFVNDWQIPKEGKIFVTEKGVKIDCAAMKCLLVTSPGNAPRSWKHLNSIYFLDGNTAFEIYDNK